MRKFFSSAVTLFVAVIFGYALLSSFNAKAQTSDATGDELEIIKLGFDNAPEAYGGIGIEPYVAIGEGVIVIAVYDDTPAQRAGIQQGDVIVEIDGASAKGIQMAEVTKRLRGETGSKISLAILRAGKKEPTTLKLVRELISVQSVLRSRKYYEVAVELLKPLADKGIPDAQNALGAFYESGLGIERDYTQAAEWYGKAAAQGSNKAQYNLAMLYLSGKGMKKDAAEALKRIHKVAEEGYLTAQKWLGEAYSLGKDVVPNKNTAILWYRKAAEQEDREASDRLIKLLQVKDVSGKHNHDEEECFWLRLSGQGKDPRRSKNPDGALPGSSPLIESLADLEERLTPEQQTACKKRVAEWKPQRVLALMEKAKEQGAATQRAIALFYWDRTRLQPAGSEYVQADYDEAIKWQSLAAEQGDIEDQKTLSNYFWTGVNIRINDFKTSQKWLLKAAEQGDLEAQTKLARISGDDGELLKWLIKASEKGDAANFGRIGDYYSRGTNGIKRNLPEALKWYLKAAEQGEENDTGYHRQNQIAELYYKGKDGIKTNYPEALKWYLKACRFDTCNFIRLGELYAEGLGTEKDYAEAYMWYAVLEAQVARGDGCGIKDSEELGALTAKMTPEQLSEGQRRAEAWLLKAVKQGSRSRAQGLGRGYARGLFGVQNYEEAYFWLQVATEKRSRAYRISSTNEELDAAAMHLTPEQLAAVKKRAEEFQFPSVRRLGDKNYGADKASPAQQAKCMRENGKECIFDLCEADADDASVNASCKAGWKSVEVN